MNEKSMAKITKIFKEHSNGKFGSRPLNLSFAVCSFSMLLSWCYFLGVECFCLLWHAEQTLEAQKTNVPQNSKEKHFKRNSWL